MLISVNLLSFYCSYLENRQGEVKNSIGNVETKELIYMTHGHELKGGMQVGGGARGRGE